MAMLGQFLCISWNFEVFSDRLGPGRSLILGNVRKSHYGLKFSTMKRITIWNGHAKPVFAFFFLSRQAQGVVLLTFCIYFPGDITLKAAKKQVTRILMKREAAELDLENIIEKSKCGYCLSQGWRKYYSDIHLTQNDKHEYTKSIVLECWFSSSHTRMFSIQPSPGVGVT